MFLKVTFWETTAVLEHRGLCSPSHGFPFGLDETFSLILILFDISRLILLDLQIRFLLVSFLSALGIHSSEVWCHTAVYNVLRSSSLSETKIPEDREGLINP